MKMLSMRPETRNIVSLVCSTFMESTGVLLEPDTVHVIAKIVDFQLCQTVNASAGWTPEQREEFLKRGVGLTEFDK